MLSDPITLYKLMILYMLDKLPAHGFLSGSRIYDILYAPAGVKRTERSGADPDGIHPQLLPL